MDDLALPWQAVYWATAGVGGLLGLWFLWKLAQVTLAERASSHLVSRMKEKLLLPASAAPLRAKLLDAWGPLRQSLEAVISQHAGVRDEREKLRDLAATFTSREAVQSLMQRKEADAPGIRRTVTILFADIRGFTAMCEHLQPDTVVRLLNNYLAQATDSIRSRGGEVNKFIGDGVLAVFHPARGDGQWNDAQRACLAAHELIGRFQDIAGAWQYYLPDGLSVGLGIGIHTGDVVEGHLGSSEKLEFGVIGDTVNTASRLCGLAPAGAVWASWDTVSKLQGFFTIQDLEAVQLKGKALPVALSRIVGLNVKPPAKS